MFKTCLNFRSNLTRLNIPYYDDTLYEIDGETGDALDFLAHFKKIKCLNTQNQDNSSLTLFKILAVFSNLVTLQLKSSLWMNADLTTVSAPPSCLQSLKLDLPNLPLHYVEYLTSGLPDCLEILKINLTDIDFDDWVEEIGQDHTLQFAIRSSRVNRFKLVANTEIENGRRIQPPEATNITVFYAFLNNLIGNRTIWDCVSELDRQNEDTIISIRDGVRLFFHYPLERQQHQQRGVSIPSPDRDISTIGHEIINCLSITLPQRTMDLPPVDIRKFFLQNCPHLIVSMLAVHHQQNLKYPSLMSYIYGASLVEDVAWVTETTLLSR